MTADYARRMGLTAGQKVRELGWDDDTDPAIQDSVRRVTGLALLDDESPDRVDVVLYWWRNGDGDLASELAYDLGPVSDDVAIWILTPGAGLPGHAPPVDITEAAADAGLRHASATALGAWTGHRLTRRPPAR
ncbi:DUF3052 family protein [Streptomyces sp. NPDC058486]|uniref:DUF3052 family protein n=1 Tax=unclassified Streptomyces TaxID=2593676 RepID=UPI003649331A